MDPGDTAGFKDVPEKKSKKQNEAAPGKGAAKGKGKAGADTSGAGQPGPAGGPGSKPKSQDKTQTQKEVQAAEAAATNNENRAAAGVTAQQPHNRGNTKADADGSPIQNETAGAASKPAPTMRPSDSRRPTPPDQRGAGARTWQPKPVPVLVVEADDEATRIISRETRGRVALQFGAIVTDQLGATFNKLNMQLIGAGLKTSLQRALDAVPGGSTSVTVPEPEVSYMPFTSSARGKTISRGSYIGIVTVSEPVAAAIKSALCGPGRVPQVYVQLDAGPTLPMLLQQAVENPVDRTFRSSQTPRLLHLMPRDEVQELGVAQVLRGMCAKGMLGGVEWIGAPAAEGASPGSARAFPRDAQNMSPTVFDEVMRQAETGQLQLPDWVPTPKPGEYVALAWGVRKDLVDNPRLSLDYALRPAALPVGASLHGRSEVPFSVSCVHPRAKPAAKPASSSAKPTNYAAAASASAQAGGADARARPDEGTATAVQLQVQELQARLAAAEAAAAEAEAAAAAAKSAAERAWQGEAMQTDDDGGEGSASKLQALQEALETAKAEAGAAARMRDKALLQAHEATTQRTEAEKRLTRELAEIRTLQALVGQKETALADAQSRGAEVALALAAATQQHQKQLSEAEAKAESRQKQLDEIQRALHAAEEERRRLGGLHLQVLINSEAADTKQALLDACEHAIQSLLQSGEVTYKGSTEAPTAAVKHAAQAVCSHAIGKWGLEEVEIWCQKRIAARGTLTRAALMAYLPPGWLPAGQRLQGPMATAAAAPEASGPPAPKMLSPAGHRMIMAHLGGPQLVGQAQPAQTSQTTSPEADGPRPPSWLLELSGGSTAAYNATTGFVANLMQRCLIELTKQQPLPQEPEAGVAQQARAVAQKLLEQYGLQKVRSWLLEPAKAQPPPLSREEVWAMMAAGAAQPHPTPNA